jgi:hypothetical protein
MNREVESASMRPLARALTRHLDGLRGRLREQCFKNLSADTTEVCMLCVNFILCYSDHSFRLKNLLWCLIDSLPNLNSGFNQLAGFGTLLDILFFFTVM